MKSYRLGIAALVVAAIALALAVLPGMIVDSPRTVSQAEYSPNQPAAIKADEPDAEPKFSLRIGRWKFGIGSKAKPENATDPDAESAGESPPPLVEAVPVDRNGEVLRWTTVSSMALGIVGLVLGPLAWTKERRRELPCCAIGMSVAALFWPYIAAGVLLGVTIVVVFVLLMILASILAG